MRIDPCLSHFEIKSVHSLVKPLSLIKSVFCFHPSVPEGKVQAEVFLSVTMMKIVVRGTYYIFSKPGKQ